LLFDERHLTQTKIAESIGITQQAISVFINLLIENDIIDQVEEEGKVIYRDKYNFLELTKE
jgi:predicted transcriptional regulator